MIKTEIKEFVEELLDGVVIPDTLFDTFLDIAQMYWENRRPWVILRTEDTSNTIGSNNTFTTEKDLPEDFRKWYTRQSIVLVDGHDNPQQYLMEIPVNLKNTYKDDSTRFYADYATKKFYVCGNVGQSLTANLYYIKKGTLVSSSNDNEWIMDSEFHSILGFSIAIYYKLGVDYDIINANQSSDHISTAKAIYESMSDWDAELAESALNGQNYGTSDGRRFGGDGLSGAAFGFGN